MNYMDLAMPLHRRMEPRSTVYEDGSILSTIIASKTHIASMKVQTIPRLELVGALILTQLVDTLEKSLKS